jgi:nucleotide-binding universal stress UspA family protein
MASFRRILVPIDFTETSDRALDWAIELAARLDASVTVMHAYEVPVIGVPDGTLIATADTAMQLTESARTALDTAVKERSGRGVPIDAILREGVAWEEINSVADSIDADVIALGTHGRHGLARALLGSVAENVIRTSNRPVMTIRTATG